MPSWTNFEPWCYKDRIGMVGNLWAGLKIHPKQIKASARSLLSILVVIIQEIKIHHPLLDWAPKADSVMDYWCQPRFPYFSIFLHIHEKGCPFISSLETALEYIRNDACCDKPSEPPPPLWISENKKCARVLGRVAMCWLPVLVARGLRRLQVSSSRRQAWVLKLGILAGERQCNQCGLDADTRAGKVWKRGICINGEK